MLQRRPGLPGRRSVFGAITLLLIPAAAQAGTLADDAQAEWRPSAIQARQLAELGQWPEALKSAQRALKSAQQIESSDRTLAELFQTVAWLLRSQGRYRDAEQHARKALVMFERADGPTHASVASCLNEAGLNLAFLGRYREAEARLRRAVAILDETGRPPLSSYVNSLGFVVEAQGRYDEAAQHYQRALAIVEQRLGPDHPHAASALSNLANIERIQGRYGRAEALYERALKIRARGAAGRPVVESVRVSELSAIHQPRAFSAERLVPEQAEEPVEASPALLAMTALAGIKTGYLEGEPETEEASPEAIPSGPGVARTLHGLGVLYLSQGRVRRAEPLLRQALIGLEQAWGPGHPDVGNVANNLGVLAHAKQEYSQAEAWYHRAQEVWANTLGRDHPTAVKARTNLAETAAAKRPATRRASGSSHRRSEALAAMAASMNRRAKVYMEFGEHTKAEELIQGVLAMYERHAVADDPAMAATLQQYIELLRKVRRFDEAEQVQLRLDALKPPK